VQAQAGAAVQAVAPAVKIYGRKALKWGLRIVAFIVIGVVYLIWKEAAAKSGTESGAMGFIRAILLFGGFLMFVEWTRELDTPPDTFADDTDADDTDDPAKGYLQAHDAVTNVGTRYVNDQFDADDTEVPAKGLWQRFLQGCFDVIRALMTLVVLFVAVLLFAAWQN
jgi:hypothetical protein